VYLCKQVEPHINHAMLAATDIERAHLSIVQQALSGRTRIVAGVKDLNRYSIQPGKTFAASAKSPEKYKVLRVIADDIVVQDLSTRKIITVQVDRLLQDWATRGIKEISLLEEIVQTVKNLLGPVLGIFLTSALLAWLTDQLK
jgi:hypothetical protein